MQQCIATYPSQQFQPVQMYPYRPLFQPTVGFMNLNQNQMEGPNSQHCVKNSAEESDETDPLSEETEANYEQKLYKEIGTLYKTLHNFEILSSSGNNPIDYKQEKLDFEKGIETKFIDIIKRFYSKLNKTKIQSIDSSVELINAKRNGSKSVRKCVGVIHRNPYMNDDKEEENETANFALKNSIEITSYTKMSKVRHLHLNEKLQSFFLGEFLDNSCCSYKVENIEVSTIISYRLYNEEGFESLVSQPIYVYFDKEKSTHILSFLGNELDTQLIFPAKSIYFHRDSKVNKLYIRGDIRVKEYTINGLDEYIQKAGRNLHPIEWNKEFDPDGSIKKQVISIVETNTFLYEGFEYDKSVITVWGNELVLGCNSQLLFWDVNETTLDNKNKNSVQVENIQMITSLAVVEQSILNSYLVVASEVYPVINIFNKDHQNVSKLISHTMGITSLFCFGSRLFSGSLDDTVRVWDLNNDMPVSLFNTISYEITAIELGSFCNQLFLFAGTSNHSVICCNWTCKKIVFEIHLSDDATPRKIVFDSSKDKDRGDYCKLAVLSECGAPGLQNIFKTIQVQYFMFA